MNKPHTQYHFWGLRYTQGIKALCIACKDGWTVYFCLVCVQSKIFGTILFENSAYIQKECWICRIKYNTNPFVTILCLIPRTTVTSLSAFKDTRYKTHPLCVNSGVPFWTREKTHKFRARWPAQRLCLECALTSRSFSTLQLNPLSVYNVSAMSWKKTSTNMFYTSPFPTNQCWTPLASGRTHWCHST